MSVAWFTRQVGDLASFGSEEHGDPSEVLIHMGDAPDYVMMPAEIGGPRPLRIIGTETGPCRVCGQPAKIYKLEERYVVFECRADGFVWCRKSEG